MSQTFTHAFHDSTITFVYERRYGSAAHNNRGRYSGEKIHALSVELVVNVEGPARPNTISAQWLRENQKPEGQKRKPVYFGVRPLCGTTQGQHAGSVFEDLTAADVTCARCLKLIGRPE